MEEDYNIFINNTSFFLAGLSHPEIVYYSTDRTKPFDYKMYSTGVFVSTDLDVSPDSVNWYIPLDMFLEKADPVFKKCEFFFKGFNHSALALYQYQDILLIKIDDERITALNTKAKYYDDYKFKYTSDALDEEQNYSPEKVKEEMKLPLKQFLAVEKLSNNEELRDEEKEMLKGLPTNCISIIKYLLMHGYSYNELKKIEFIKLNYYDTILSGLNMAIFDKDYDELINMLAEIGKRDFDLAVLVATCIHEIVMEQRTVNDVVTFLKSEGYDNVQILQVLSSVSRFANINNNGRK